MTATKGFEPLVSVLITNYNFGAYVKECIESVLHQTYANLDVVVVDDGSTDDSLAVIQGLAEADPRITVIAQNNGGQAAALNAGFAKARGEIVCFLDSDDYWAEDKVAKVVEAFAEGDYVLVQHRLWVVDKDSRSSGETRTGGIFTGNILDRYFRENKTSFFVSTSGVSCRKAELNKLFPLDERFTVCADIALTRPLPLFGEILTLEPVLGYYRLHGRNNWAGTEKGTHAIRNELAYTRYVNGLLKRFGETRTVRFRLSRQYQDWVRTSLGCYHPLHFYFIRLRPFARRLLGRQTG